MERKSNYALHCLCQGNCGIVFKQGVFQLRNLCAGWAPLASFITCPRRGWSKSHVRKTRGSAQLRELWQAKAGGCQSVVSSWDTEKKAKATTQSLHWDLDSTLMSGLQPTAAWQGWAPGKQLSWEAIWYLQLKAALFHHNQVGQERPWSGCCLLVPRLSS